MSDSPHLVFRLSFSATSSATSAAEMRSFPFIVRLLIVPSLTSAIMRSNETPINSAPRWGSTHHWRCAGPPRLHGPLLSTHSLNYGRALQRVSRWPPAIEIDIHSFLPQALCGSPTV